MRLFNVFFTICIFVVAATFAAERNIIFFITDDESPTLGCYGDRCAHTPAIDRVAADGTVFMNAFATTASCSASRSVVMSGIHNHMNGLYGHAHSKHKFAAFPDLVSLALPRVLANEGYRTVQIGKYHVAPEQVFHFETYLKGNSRNAVEMAEKVKDVIMQKSERPFFIYFGTSDPHRGGGIDKSVPGKYKPDLFGNLPDRGSHDGVDEKFFKPQDVVVPPFLPDTPEVRQELVQYYQSCARIDQGVARLVDILKGAGVYDKTLIVFTSDHGMAFPGGKTTVYEGGLRVPFVVRNPYEKNRGIRSAALISHVDITPSLLDFAGGLHHKRNAPRKWVDPKRFWRDKEHMGLDNRNGGYKFTSYHGRSWLSILGDPQADGHTEIIASHTFHEIQMYYPMRVLRDREYKLIWNIAHGLPYPFASDLWAASSWQAQWDKGMNAPFGLKTVREYLHRPAFELYRIDKDPWESRNLAGNPEYVEVLKKYQERLRNWQSKLNDPWLLKWEYE
jgi:N-sulfoglucosamine sulfohydrolase